MPSGEVATGSTEVSGKEKTCNKRGDAAAAADDDEDDDIVLQKRRGQKKSQLSEDNAIWIFILLLT
jgi:hypothetical protein